MIHDRLSMFSQAQLVTASAVSSNVLDVGAHGDDIQRELTFFVQCRAAITADGAATVKFALRTSATLTAGALDAPVTLFETAAIAKASLTDGSFPVKIALPPGVLKYLDVYYTVATGPLTLLSAFDAGLAFGIDLP